MWRGASGGTGGTLSGVTLGPFTGPSEITEMRNGTTAQNFRVFNTYTNDSNNEYGSMFWSSNAFRVGTVANGSGTLRETQIGGGGIRFFANGFVTATWLMSASGHLVAITDNASDIGGSGANRPRNVYVGSSVFLTAPVTETGASRTILATDNFVIANVAGTQTLTLGTATAGRVLWVRTIQAQLVISASSNVVPLIGGSAGTAILPATDGAWAMLVGDGTNWQIMASSVV